MSSHIVAELITHLGRIAAGDGYGTGLTTVQWAALRYFTHANRFSRTPSAFAAFHGTTRGTASQTIKSLVEQGYLKPVRSKADGRSVQLDPTEKARFIAPQDPIEALVEAADALPPSVRGAFSHALRHMIGQVARKKGKPLFGTCEACTHFQGEGCCQNDDAAYACGFVNEPLIKAELIELCINFASDRPPPHISGMDAA